jgi:hypothetical protein
MCLDSVIRAAKEEKWDVVDQQIPDICNDAAAITWASTQGLRDDDGNVRDLAASILEKTTAPLEPGIKRQLLHHMKTDGNPYVRFRSAFALTGHDPKYHKTEVAVVLREAEKDSATGEIAKTYLGRLQS